MSGKGSKPRPFSVSADEYADRYEAIFGKKNDAPSSNGKAAVSTTENLRSSRSGAATYVDNETGV